jgi:hypothetical protein
MEWQKILTCSARVSFDADPAVHTFLYLEGGSIAAVLRKALRYYLEQTGHVALQPETQQRVRRDALLRALGQAAPGEAPSQAPSPPARGAGQAAAPAPVPAARAAPSAPARPTRQSRAMETFTRDTDS